MELLIKLCCTCKVPLILKSVWKKKRHSNEGYLAVLSCGAVYCAAQAEKVFLTFEPSDEILKKNLLCGTR